MARPVPALLATVLLMAAIATDRFGIRFHGLNLRFELLAAGLLVLWLLATQKLAAIPALGLIEWCLLGWLVIGAFSSLVFSPARAQSLKLTLLLAGLLVLYALTSALLRSPDAVVGAAALWVAGGAAVATIGVIEALLYVVPAWQAGISFQGSYEAGITTILPKVHSTLWEPNILASYLLTVWALAFALSCVPATRPAQRRWLRVAMALSATGIVLSSTRAVWLIAPLLIAAVGVIAVRRGIISRRRLLSSLVNPSLLGVALGLGVLLVMPVGQCTTTTPSASVAPPASATAGTPTPSGNPLAAPGCVRTGSALLGHVRGFFAPAKESSVSGRANIDKLAFQGWLENPILGHGSGSYLYVFGPQGGGWIGNLELHVLFDTGLAGFVLLLIAVAATTWRGARALASPVASWDATRFVLFGLLAGGAGVLAAYQLTEGSWLGLTWVFLGILVAAGRQALRASAPG